MFQVSLRKRNYRLMRRRRHERGWTRWGQRPEDAARATTGPCARIPARQGAHRSRFVDRCRLERKHRSGLPVADFSHQVSD
ncbi:MAG: hypothetical protein D6757_11265, partial [Alphaproteobacteria bacterium]